MTQTFTLKHNDILRYLYNETSETENELIEETLISDQELLEFYLDAIDLKIVLDEAIMTPPDWVVSNIMAYSGKFANIQAE